MKNFLKLIPVFFAAFVFNVQAAVITFEDLPENFESTDIVSGGFRFQANNDGAIYVTNGAACNPPCASNGTRTLTAAGPLFGYADEVTVTRAAGGDFMLTSVDAAELFPFPFLADNAASIAYQGLLDGMVVTSGSLMLDQIVDGPGGVDDFQTLMLSGAVVDTFIFTGMGGLNGNNGFTLDNLVVVEVPEPGTVSLAVLGLIGMAFGRRRARGRAAACPDPA